MKFAHALIALFLCISTVSIGSAAHATRARLQSLGQDKNGSLFIEDSRNIFLNPAYITKVSNQLNLEAGSADRISGATTNEPKAEGGIVYQTGALSLGGQLGRISKAADQIDDQPSLAGVNFYDPQNSIDLVIGGGAGLSWGALLHYANSESDTGATADFPDSDARILSARGGVLTDRFQAYGNVDVIHESSTQTSAAVTQKYDGDLGFEIGGAFNLDSVSKVGGYVLRTGNNFDNGAGLKGDYELMRVSVSYFYNFRKEEELMVFGIGGVFYEDGKSSYDASGTDDEKQEYLLLPVGLGFESKMTSWLKLRGSVTQNVLIDKSEYSNGTGNLETQSEDDTVVTVGTSLTFDSFTLDATLEGTGSAGNGEINGNSLMANVGLIYTF